MAKDLAVVLSSGSLGSAVLCTLAAQRNRLVMVHAETELMAAGGATSRLRAAYDMQVAHFKPYREHVVPLAPIAGAAVASAPADPRHAAPVVEQITTLLPLLGLATRLAYQYEAAAIYLGLRIGTEGENLAAATEFVQIWNEMVQLPCRMTDLELQCPLMELEAWQVVDLGVQSHAPLDRTWSCLESGADPCGVCRGCRAREAAFRQAAKADPMKSVKK